MWPRKIHITKYQRRSPRISLARPWTAAVGRAGLTQGKLPHPLVCTLRAIKFLVTGQAREIRSSESFSASYFFELWFLCLTVRNTGCLRVCPWLYPPDDYIQASMDEIDTYKALYRILFNWDFVLSRIQRYLDGGLNIEWYFISQLSTLHYIWNEAYFIRWIFQKHPYFTTQRA